MDEVAPWKQALTIRGNERRGVVWEDVKMIII